MRNLHFLPLYSEDKHMQNTPITRLVTGFSLMERRIKQPARAGFVKAVGIEPSLALRAATKPKASLAGFFMGGRNTPQSGLANGPTWAALKKHRHCIRPQARRPAFLSGTDQDLGTTVETPPFRVNDSLKGLWVTEQDSVSGSGKESSDSTLARPMEQQKEVF